MALDIARVRARFPALAREHESLAVAYLDGPGGTQVPRVVIDAIARPLQAGVSNLGGGFGASRDAEEVAAAARRAAADLLGASPREIVFGQNMTSLTFAMSRALARDWAPGGRIVVTALDHAANIDPWRAVAEERGLTVHQVDFDRDTGVLDPADVAGAIDGRTRIVAVTAASNALGSVTDLNPIVAAAHHQGALVYVDAVHFSAHRLSDVHASGVDFLVASAYKFFGPHTGILYGARRHLEEFEPFKVVPAPKRVPERWETGTQSFESLAGVDAAVEYLASLEPGPTRRDRLEASFKSIGEHESDLAQRFMRGLAELSHVHLHGPGPGEGDRVATFAISVDGHHPVEVTAFLADRGIYAWSGHYYAVDVMRHLGLENGAVRVGFVHYNTREEVDRALEALDQLG